MDKRTDDDGRRTPLERIKAEHEQMRNRIMYGNEDSLEWDTNMNPEQAGLTRVWADDAGNLWKLTRVGHEMRLERIWTIT